MNIVWTRRAVRDLTAARAFIAAEDPKAARAQVRLVLAAVRRVANYPDSGRPGRVGGTRELVIGRSNFIVAYRVQSGRVEVLAVMHAAQAWPEEF